MRHVVLVAVCALVLVACGDEDEQPAAPKTELTVSVWPSGPDGPVRRHRVVCPGDPACRGLSRARLRPVPRNVACTQIYGGPATARVRGTLAGEPIDARFDRTNGCEIARWERNRLLLRAR